VTPGIVLQPPRIRWPRFAGSGVSFGQADQFAYRYNTDERTVIAAIAVPPWPWFTLFASWEPKN